MMRNNMIDCIFYAKECEIVHSWTIYEESKYSDKTTRIYYCKTHHYEFYRESGVIYINQ